MKTNIILLIILLTIFAISGFVDKDKIADYDSNRQKYISKGRGIGFQTAVKHMDEYKSDPLVCTFFFCSNIIIIQ